MKSKKRIEPSQLRVQAATIEKEWAAHKKRLLALPERLGYSAVQELIKALKFVQKDRPKRLVAEKRFRKNRKARAEITASTKAELKRLIGAGKTGREIADALNLSISTVQNIKTELGLAKARPS